MNIPRLRRGRKRRRSDPVEHQSSGSTTSWADRFGEEINGGGTGSGSGSGTSDVQQLRRASTNTMPELLRYQYENNLFPPGSGPGGGEELASSAYLNSLMRRESMPVSMRTHTQGRGLSDILDPTVRTSSPMGYSAFRPTSTQMDQLRRSMTPSVPPTGHWHPASSMVRLCENRRGQRLDEADEQTPELNYHQSATLPPVLPPISHDSSPLNWHTAQMVCHFTSLAIPLLRPPPPTGIYISCQSITPKRRPTTSPRFSRTVYRVETWPLSSGPRG